MTYMLNYIAFIKIPFWLRDWKGISLNITESGYLNYTEFSLHLKNS